MGHRAVAIDAQTNLPIAALKLGVRAMADGSLNDQAVSTTKSGRQATALDVVIGHRIRRARLENGFSQTELATRVGVSFQQIQKYELGANRISAAMLIALANELARPVSWFCSPPDETNQADAREGSPNLDALLADKDVRELLTVFGSVASPRVRRRIVNLITALVSDAP